MTSNPHHARHVLEMLRDFFGSYDGALSFMAKMADTVIEVPANDVVEALAVKISIACSLHRDPSVANCVRLSALHNLPRKCVSRAIIEMTGMPMMRRRVQIEAGGRDIPIELRRRVPRPEGQKRRRRPPLKKPKMPQKVPDVMLTREIAARLGISRYRVHYLRRDGRIPAPDAKLSKSYAWRRETIEPYLIERGEPRDGGGEADRHLIDSIEREVPDALLAPVIEHSDGGVLPQTVNDHPGS